MNAPTELCEQLQCYVRAKYVFNITNCLHELGTAARRITNKKVGKQKFCIENLLPDFNF